MLYEVITLFVQAAGDPESFRMVGDREVPVSLPFRGMDHRVEVVGTVRPVRVDMEVSPNLLDGQQAGKFTVRGRLESYNFV